MPELACPNCGRAGSVPREKMNSRLVCKKCHMVFHMNSAGRAVLGEPRVDPSKSGVNKAEKSGFFKALEDAPIPTLSSITELKDSLGGNSLPLKPILIGLVAVAIGWGTYSLLFGPPESIADRATAIAQAFASDDLAYLKKNATSDSVDDIVLWFNANLPQIVQARKEWKGGAPVVQTTVVEEDRAMRSGEVEAYLYPPQMAARAQSIESAGAPIKPVELHLRFALEGGKWRLNGKQMAKTLTPTPTPEAMNGP
jgi:hypothetical protein